MLARKMGKKRIIAETGAGQHGVATAAVCAMLGIECIVYMGEEDIRRQAPNVFRMKLLGARVEPVTSGSRTLKDAVNEAIRDWVTNCENTHYMLGSVVGPHPYPSMVRDFQSIIGQEARKQIFEQTGKLPDFIACVGGGSNAMGIFHPFLEDKEVKLIGVEAAGRGIESGQHAAPLVAGKSRSAARRQVLHSPGPSTDRFRRLIAFPPDLDYPGVGPEHAILKEIGRASYVSITDAEALEGFQLLSPFRGNHPGAGVLSRHCPMPPK